MFGGTCFMLNGNMLVCAMRDDNLLARVGADLMEASLARAGAARMVMGGREMKDYVVVAAEALDDDALAQWIADARRYVEPMPPKAGKTARRRRGTEG